MDINIIERSNAWKNAVTSECQSMFPDKDVKSLSMFEQLQLLFDDEVCAQDGAAMFHYLKREYHLQVTIGGNDVPRLNPVVVDALRLGNDLFRLLPTCWLDGVNLKKLDKSKFGFAARNETAVFQIWRNINASITEMQVRTAALNGEFLYWNKDKIFVMSFVSEFDEDHAVAGSYTLHMRRRYS